MEVSNISRKQGNEDLVNENIRFKEVLVIDQNGTQLGILSRDEALNLAYDADLDLFCVAPGGHPPVCKFIDYGRYRFEQQKKTRESKKNQHVTEIKQIRVSPVIDQHDFDTKLRQARKWLEEGIKVKVDMRFRGRMMTRQDVGKIVMNSFVEATADLAGVEKQPSLEGNIMSVVLSPKKK